MNLIFTYFEVKTIENFVYTFSNLQKKNCLAELPSNKATIFLKTLSKKSILNSL